MGTTRTILVSFMTNLFLIVFKTLFGIIGNSGALIADAIHSFSDVSVDLFALIGLKLIKKEADEKHPYGYGKIEYLISLIMGLVITLLGFTIIKESFNKEIVIPSLLVILISMFTIIIKLMLSSYVINKGKEYKNNILISSGSESRSDVISSIVVMLSVILMNFSNKIHFLKYTDIIASILVGLIILNIGLKIIKENVSILLDENENDIYFKTKIAKVFLKEPKVCYIDNIIILKLGPYNKIIVKVSMDYKITLLEAQTRIDKIKRELLNMDKIKYVIIDISPYIEKDYDNILRG